MQLFSFARALPVFVGEFTAQGIFWNCLNNFASTWKLRNCRTTENYWTKL